MKYEVKLLVRARSAFDGLRGFREDRERCKRFTYGDQWCDAVTDNGVRMSESQYIASQGNMPLKNNLIRRLVRNVLGVYRNQWQLPLDAIRDQPDADHLKELLVKNAETNRLEELYARTMEEFLISGLAVHKKWYGFRRGDFDCRTDHVSPSQFFFDTSARDFRGDDVTLVGEVHDIRADELLACFARDPDERLLLSKIYGFDTADCYDVNCTVYEVWEKCRPMRLYCHDPRSGVIRRFDGEPAEIDRENKRRRRLRQAEIRTKWRTDEEWHYHFLAPDGAVLRQGVSPYHHGSHPYVFKPYPFIDGEIHSFVGDIIDQQKLTNRLISMYDWILRASAKGVLLFPEGSFPEGVDINDIADEWGRFNGIIVYRPRPGVPVPQQISSKSADIGITQLLEIQMKMMEDISGVNGALQGKLESNSMSGTLYNQQTRNSLTALADMIKCFGDFAAEATRRDASNLRQFKFP